MREQRLKSSPPLPRPPPLDSYDPQPNSIVLIANMSCLCLPSQAHLARLLKPNNRLSITFRKEQATGTRRADERRNKCRMVRHVNAERDE
eukprot:2774913-Pleurochrysis_carterae.AAC.1